MNLSLAKRLGSATFEHVCTLYSVLFCSPIVFIQIDALSLCVTTQHSNGFFKSLWILLSLSLSDSSFWIKKYYKKVKLKTKSSKLCRVNYEGSILLVPEDFEVTSACVLVFEGLGLGYLFIREHWAWASYLHSFPGDGLTSWDFRSHPSPNSQH